MVDRACASPPPPGPDSAKPTFARPTPGPDGERLARVRSRTISVKEAAEKVMSEAYAAVSRANHCSGTLL